MSGGWCLSLTGLMTLKKSLALSGTMGSLYSVALRPVALAARMQSLGIWGLQGSVHFFPNICAPIIRKCNPTYSVILRRDMEEGTMGVGKKRPQNVTEAWGVSNFGTSGAGI